ncbi:MAG: hypothetical protein ACYC93_09680 [Candidatus Acidiferrales bacterium]
MHKLLFAMAFFAVALPATAKDIYVAQNAAGAANGADCADAYAYTFFNTAGNWGTGATQIGPGTTVHLCGTFTAAAGANGYIAFQSSGTNGNPITLKFEPSAVLTAPYWGTNGAIYDHQDYTVVDGGTPCGVINGSVVACNGIIQATANGTNLANQVDSTEGIDAGCNNCEFKDIALSNIYVHACTLPVSNCTDRQGFDAIGIMIRNGDNITIDHNTCSNAGNCYRLVYPGSTTASGFYAYNNEADHYNWGIIVGDGNTSATLNAPVAVHDNILHDNANWDDANDDFHHDSVFCFATNSGSALNACQIYNNYFYGDVGTTANTFTYVSGVSTGVGCSGVEIFNNLFTNTGPIGHYPANGMIQDWCSGTLIYNNTLVGNSATTNASGNVGISVNTGIGTVIKNNIMSTFYIGIYKANGANISSSNNNDFYNLGNSVVDIWGTNCCTTLAAWQATSGTPDLNSTTGNPNLNGTFTLQTGSVAIGLGANLTSLGISALDSDKAGIVRPPVGSTLLWSAGAYQFGSSVSGPQPATGATAIAH